MLRIYLLYNNPMRYADLTLQQKADFVLNQLKKDYPEVSTPLIHANVFQLLIAVVLSPQTKDETTNTVTPTLFEKYPSVHAFANANPEDIEPIIRVINYHKTKAKRLVQLSQILIDNFDSQVPKTIDELMTLPGVGRKVANVIVSEWFNKKEGSDPEGFVVDTHVLRVSYALQLTKNKVPHKVEQDLMKLFPKKEWRDLSLRFIFHGRDVFQAKKPAFKNHPVWSEVYEELGY